MTPTQTATPPPTPSPTRTGTPPPAGGWVQNFVALRQFYVAPGASGTGAQNNPMGIATALANAQPGDLFWLRRGTYQGSFYMGRSGTQTNAIVYRAYPGERVTIMGQIIVEAAHNWIWGLEVTDPSADTTGIHVAAAGVHLINNVIHDIRRGMGIGAWNVGPGQVYYGNITYNLGLGDEAYNVYGQNDFSQNGYKYLVNNIFLDTPTFNLHFYTETGFTSGIYLYRNIVRGARVLLGGKNLPSDGHMVIENYFHENDVQFGYARPAQVEFRDNYLVRSTFVGIWHWGRGDGSGPQQPRPNIFTGNSIYLPKGAHVMIRTSAYIGGTVVNSTPLIPSADVFNNNTYSTPFQGWLQAGTVSSSSLDLAGWQAGTASAGNAFDRASRVTSVPTQSKAVLLPNDYETGRGHLVIYRWGGASSVSVDLSTVVPIGSRFSIYDARNPFGTPVLTGTYSGPVAVPVSGEFSAFLVLAR